MKKLLLFTTHLCLSASLISQVTFKPRQPNKTSIFDLEGELETILNRTDAWGDTIYLGPSKTGKDSIYAYYYNRGGKEKAMVMAGVHGSEFYGVTVLDSLKIRLDKMKDSVFKWKIILLPRLFAENIKSASKVPFDTNAFRSSCKKCTDPNRQMPFINTLYKNGNNKAHFGEIEKENQYLLLLTQIFNPSRIASVHCKNSWIKKK